MLAGGHQYQHHHPIKQRPSLDSIQRQVRANNSPTSQRNDRLQSDRRQLTRAWLWRQSFLWAGGRIVCDRSTVLRFSSQFLHDLSYARPIPRRHATGVICAAAIGRERRSRRHFHPARAGVVLSSRALEQIGLSSAR